MKRGNKFSSSNNIPVNIYTFIITFGLLYVINIIYRNYSKPKILPIIQYPNQIPVLTQQTVPTVLKSTVTQQSVPTVVTPVVTQQSVPTVVSPVVQSVTTPVNTNVVPPVVLPPPFLCERTKDSYAKGARCQGNEKAKTVKECCTPAGIAKKNMWKAKD
jgi:hypothetical protein